MDAFMSMITPYGCTFTIRNWGFCGGALLDINQFNALYSLLGTSFGGDGRTSFGVPDLRGRSPSGFGTGPGLSTVTLGQKGGLEYSSLTTANLPPHQFTVSLSGTTSPTTTSLPVSSDLALGQDPDGAYLGQLSGSTRVYSSTLSSPMGEMGPIPIPSQTVTVSGTSNTVGAGTDFYTRSPYQGVNYQICLVGIYPSRS